MLFCKILQRAYGQDLTTSRFISVALMPLSTFLVRLLSARETTLLSTTISCAEQQSLWDYCERAVLILPRQKCNDLSTSLSLYRIVFDIGPINTLEPAYLKARLLCMVEMSPQRHDAWTKTITLILKRVTTFENDLGLPRSFLEKTCLIHYLVKYVWNVCDPSPVHFPNEIIKINFNCQMNAYFKCLNLSEEVRRTKA